MLPAREHHREENCQHRRGHGRIRPDGEALKQALHDVDVAYLSGITLAILSPADRRTLFDALATLRARGGLVVFDPNLRPALWPSVAEMAEATRTAYGYADIALPTYPDEDLVFHDKCAEATALRIASYGPRDVVVKCGSDPCLVLADGQIERAPAVHVANPVDTSGAGDSFNAAYLVARLQDARPREATRFAHAVAALAIQTRGALIDRNALFRLRTF